MQFTVLASGSSGNACLVSADGYGLLIDFGLGPRALARRLDDVGCSLGDVHAALLTHLHGDHWHEGTLELFAERGIALYCHARHADDLRHHSPAFLEIERRDLVSSYEMGFEHLVGPGWRCLPFALPHD